MNITLPLVSRRSSACRISVSPTRLRWAYRELSKTAETKTGKDMNRNASFSVDIRDGDRCRNRVRTKIDTSLAAGILGGSMAAGSWWGEARKWIRTGAVSPRQVRLGLALGGGFARGIAHIGVLRVF